MLHRLYRLFTITLVVFAMALPCPCDHAEVEDAETSCCTNAMADGDQPADDAHTACPHCDDDTFVASVGDAPSPGSIQLDEPVIPPPLRGAHLLASTFELRRAPVDAIPRPPPAWDETRVTTRIHLRHDVWLC